MKYFLYVYQPDSSKELNMSQESDLGNSSIECEAEQTKDGGWLMHLMLAIDCILFGHCRTLSCIWQVSYYWQISPLPIHTSYSEEWLCDSCVSCPILIWKRLNSRLLEVTQSDSTTMTIYYHYMLMSWYGNTENFCWVWTFSETVSYPSGKSSYFLSGLSYTCNYSTHNTALFWLH